MKEESKGTDNAIVDSIEQSNNESGINNNIANVNYINKYTPFKFNLTKNIRIINKDLKKYFGFIYYENENHSKSIEKNDKNNNKINDNENKENKNLNNKNDNIINSSYNSNNNLNYPYVPNLDNLINIVREDEENEYTESEENRVVDYHSYSDDDFGVGPTFNIRPNSCLKTVIVNIVDTYNTLDPNYKYQAKKEEEDEEEGEEEEENNTILTNPSEPVKNNGLDNIYNDLIVSKEDEIKYEKKKISYIVKDLLGTGVSGQAFKVFCPNDNNYYALKIIKNKAIITKFCLVEIKIMELLNEKDNNDQNHIIRLNDYFLYKNHLCIVLELLQKNLLELLEMNNSKGISLGSIRYISRQILQAVDFMHKLKIVHTDLKPENILLSVYKDDNNENEKSNLNLSNVNIQKNNLNQINANNMTNSINNTNNISTTSRINRKVQIKIADFGSACLLKNLESKEYIQSLYYRAPEVIIGMKQKNEKVDIWSIGCILGELYLGTPIMPGSSSYDQLYKIKTLIGECPQYMIEHCKKKDKYFIKNNFHYRIKIPEEYYKENPKEPRGEYTIPKNMKSIDDLINAKDTIKSKNSLHRSMHNSSFSQSSSITREDLAAFIHLMKGMLQIDPNKRFSCKQCLKHPFITKEKLDKLISFENEINQFMSNSFNSNNSYNFQNNNCHSMVMNNSFNKFQMNKGGYVNKNNTFYGGNINSINKNNYSFGNFNNNYNNLQIPYPLLPQNQNINNNMNPHNFNNNIFQGNNNFMNKKLNSSFSFNNNYYMNINNNIFNFDPNKKIAHAFPENFLPHPYYAHYKNINNFDYYNQNINNKNNPNMIYSNNNNSYMKHNKTFIGNSDKLNNSFNSNISKNSKNNKHGTQANQPFHKNKKNVNPKEFLFNKENIILGNLEDNKQEIKFKDNINIQGTNSDKNNLNIDNELSKNDINNNLNINENILINNNKIDNNSIQEKDNKNDFFEEKK